MMNTDKGIQRDIYDDDDIVESTPERESTAPEPERRYPKRNRKPRTDLLHYHTGSSTSKESKQKKSLEDEENSDKLDRVYSWYKWSDCKMAQRYDRERNFEPQPGPSNLNYYEHDDLTGYYRPVKETKSPTRSNRRCRKRANNTPAQKRSTHKPKERKTSEVPVDSPVVNGLLSPSFSNDSDWENDIQVQSFYEQTMMKQPTSANGMSTPDDCLSPISLSPEHHDSTIRNTDASILNMTIDTPMMTKLLENVKNISTEEKPRSMPQKPADRCKLQFKNAPNQIEIRRVLDSHQLPKVVHPIPYYSDPNDIVAETSKKEVGHTVLQLNGNAVNDCEEFQSQINVTGLSKWQSIIAKQSTRGSRSRDQKSYENGNTVRTVLAKERKIRVAPSQKPPDHVLAKRWLKMREQTNDISTKRPSAQNGEVNGHVELIPLPAKLRRENDIGNKGTLKQMDNVQPNQATQPNGRSKANIVKELLAKKELTIRRITTRGMKKISPLVSDDDNHVEILDDSDDDVICLGETLPTNNSNVHSFSQLVGSTK